MTYLRSKESLSKTGRSIVNFWRRGKGFRDGFVKERVYSEFSEQVYAMRKKRSWSQSKLAEEANSHQPRISEIENPSNGGLTLETMLKVAAAYDVALSVKLKSYSEYLDDIENSDGYEVLAFEEDNLSYTTDAVHDGWMSWVSQPSMLNDLKEIIKNFEPCDNQLFYSSISDREFNTNPKITIRNNELCE